jgi:hypothetical protein
MASCGLYNPVKTLDFDSKLIVYINMQNSLSISLVSKHIKIKIYKTIILYGCDIWSLTLKEEFSPCVLKNRVLSKTSEPKKDEVTGE